MRHAFKALGVAEGDRDREVHVRNSELRLDAAVDELHHRVDDALRMDDHIDGAIGHIEEEMRLDDLEALVHHGGGVDGDLGAHLPARVGKGFRNRDRLKGLEGAAQKRTA